MKFAIALLAAMPLLAQQPTQAGLGQIRSASPNPAVLVFVPCVMPCVPLRLAELDPSVAITVVGGQATIRAVLPSAGAQVYTRKQEPVTQPQQSWTLADQFILASLEVYRNGFLLQAPMTSVTVSGVTTWSGPDYSITGNTITFTAAQTLQTGEVLIFKYLRQ